MEKDVLSQVIEAEKEIQKCLEAEKVKVQEWIETFKKESEADFLSEERTIRESLDRALAEAEKQAQAKAGEIVSDAGKSAARLGKLSPQALRQLVEQRLAKILPG